VPGTFRRTEALRAVGDDRRVGLALTAEPRVLRSPCRVGEVLTTAAILFLSWYVLNAVPLETPRHEPPPGKTKSAQPEPSPTAPGSTLGAS